MRQIILLTTIFTLLSTTNLSQDKGITPKNWKNTCACKIKFYAPKSLINLNTPGTDSCISEFENGDIRISIDYGLYGGLIGKSNRKSEFKEEVFEIDGKRTQLVTYVEKEKKKKYVTGIYVDLSGEQDESGMKTSLNMTIAVKNEKDKQTAMQIYRSIKFQDEYCIPSKNR